MSVDDFNLDRFVVAQEPVIDRVRDELRRGRKTSHWMWFVFPQVAGLGASLMSQRYAIASLDEARAYLDHPLLGPRLIECVELVLATDCRSAYAIFGSPDDMKLRSSLTLFTQAGGGDLFRDALERFFDGKPDQATLDRLG